MNVLNVWLKKKIIKLKPKVNAERVLVNEAKFSK